MDQKIKNKKELEKKRISIFQILILVIGFIAFVWVIGSSVDLVSAVDPPCEDDLDCMQFGEGYTCDTITKTCVIELEEPPEEPPTPPPSNNGIPKRLDKSFCEFADQCLSNFCSPSKHTCEQQPTEDGGISAMEILTYLPTVIDTGKTIWGWLIPSTEAVTAGAATGAAATVVGTTATLEVGVVGEVITASTTTLSYVAPTTTVISTTSTSIGLSSLTEILGNAAGAFAGAFIAAYGFAYVVQWLGGSDRNVNALMDTALYVALAVAATVTVLSSVTVAETSILLIMLPFVAALSTAGPAVIAAVIVIIAMSIYLLASYQVYSQELYSYHVQEWQPPVGGEKCEDCNKLRYGCGEYQCHSFGQACEIINKGTLTETCTWKNKNDMLPPELSPISEVLTPGYSYIPSKATLPTERGVEIVYNNNCVPPFTTVVLAVRTNEPATCKIDTQRRENFTDMIGYMSEGKANTYNHTLQIPSSSIPSNSSLEGANLSIDNDNEYQFFIRCMDTNGNPTTSNFLMEFCVDDGPDLTAPVIQATSYARGYVSYNTPSVALEVYTNEPAECKWDFQDIDYTQMRNNMTGCSKSIGDYLNQYYYGCKTELTGIKNNQKNNHYIKCKDQPWLEFDAEKRHLRNKNKQSYVQSLIGTKPLVINSILINDNANNVTIKDAADTIKIRLKVRTSEGAEQGKAKCSYLLNQNYVFFYNLGVPEYVSENTQDLWLQQGNYNYSIKCQDLAGNKDYANAIFKVEKDSFSPRIARVYHEEENLKLITDEPAQCVYSNVGCNYLFEDGAEINNVEGIDHFVTWNTEVNYYIKCKDKYGNSPLFPNQCSIIVKGTAYTS